MAKVKLNPVLESIRGKIGDLVFKQYGREDIVTKLPDRSGVVPTAGQLAQMARFRLAAFYGRAVLADEESRSIYEASATRKGKPLFAVTVGDFLNAPVVDEIDLSVYNGQIGDVIRVRATDDVEIQGVTITIRNQEGEVLEEGLAVWALASGSWDYTATSELAQGQAASIEVTATDRPGHRTTRTESHS